MGHRNFKTLVTTFGLMYGAHIGAKTFETKKYVSKTGRTGVLHYELSTRKKPPFDVQFSKADGSHLGLTQYIKRRLRKPQSYRHIRTHCRDGGRKTLQVTMTYQALNWSGDATVQTVYAEISSEGMILSFRLA